MSKNKLSRREWMAASATVPIALKTSLFANAESDVLLGPRGLYRTPVAWASKSWMNRIWSWDHCFAALGIAPLDPELALSKINLSLFNDYLESIWFAPAKLD